MSLFESLLETEKRLDQAITQKKMAVEEAHFKKIKKLSTVRIHLSLERTAEDTLFILIGGKVKTETEEPEEVKTKSIGTIINKLFVSLKDENSELSGSSIPGQEIGNGQPGNNSTQLGKNNPEITQLGNNSSRNSSVNNLSHSLPNDRTFFEWHNRNPPTDISEFEIKTLAKSSKGRIYISFISHTGVYELCDDLSKHVGIKRGSKSSIVLSIWKYITGQKMRDPSKPKVIFCNDVFKKVFNQEETSFSEIIQRLDEYLLPVEMVEFDFAIPTVPGTKNQLAFDIKTELDPVTREYAYSNGTKISVLNKKIEDILVRIEKQDEKIESLDRFISDPREYISKWILDSSKDLHLIADDLFDISDGFYSQKEIQESVYQLLQNYK